MDTKTNRPQRTPSPQRITALTLAPIPVATEAVATDVIGAAIEVHRQLGPGFLGIPSPGQRIDLIVASCVVVELKAAARIDFAHEAKMVSYLRTTGNRLGLLLNFNCRTMKEGLKRIVV